MDTRNYALVTAGYWSFTLTDGALRMLVLLHFHDLGWSPVSLAFLFLAYEFMGVVTNLLGGWVGSRTGLHRTLVAGLGLQVVALALLTLHSDTWREVISVIFVMGVQALSGVAKDLTKMSSKSAVKFVASNNDGALFRLVAVLTGSKNALKGVGFFVGAALLARFGYDASLWLLAGLVALALIGVVAFSDGDIGRSKGRTPLTSILAKSPAINRLSAARFFLFASRDIWFVVALPVFLSERLNWSFEATGAFLALWVIGYGVVQSFAPKLLGSAPSASTLVVALGFVALALAIVATLDLSTSTLGVLIVGGLGVFGLVFALNSSLHSYLILALSDPDEVALDVGFYYSANAAGRLVGTLLSGVLYLAGGLAACLWGTTAALAICWIFTRSPEQSDARGHNPPQQ